MQILIYLVKLQIEKILSSQTMDENCEIRLSISEHRRTNQPSISLKMQTEIFPVAWRIYYPKRITQKYGHSFNFSCVQTISRTAANTINFRLRD